MYTLDEYKTLTSKYGSYASWAIWDYQDSEDTTIIDKNFDQLHSKFILLGLNISRPLSNKPPWSNFHDNSHARKIMYACNNTQLCGSYMTDIFKGIVEPISTKIGTNLTDKTIRENVNYFKQEMVDIKLKDDSQFIIFGELALQYFAKYFKQGYKNNIIYFKHYSSRGTDKNWVEGFWKKLNINQEFDLTIKKYKQ